MGHCEITENVPGCKDLARISRSRCKIRKDLLEEELGVPIGEEYFHGNGYLSYRWLRLSSLSEQFQVFYKEKWQDAYPIDFDF